MTVAARSTSSSLPAIERQMAAAVTYEEWKALALEHDRASGKDAWKRKEKSKSYDDDNLRGRLDALVDLRSREDYHGMLFALNEGIHGNQGGMGKSQLYEKAKFGTKALISDYVDEVVRCLDILAELPEEIVGFDEKMDFFQRASLCFGRSALMLSGAGSLGHFHGGVAKTLIEHDLLPDVISGSSAGSVFAAILGTHTNDELKAMFSKDVFNQRIREAVARPDDGSHQDSADGQSEKPEKIVQIDSASMRIMLDAVIPDITFQEAYEKTGRKISVTIAPLEEHQTSRLMNAVTSPNVFIRTAVKASCAVPGIFPPVMLMAKNVYGEPQPYLPNRRWVDGAVTDDLPARRLARLYAVNHYIVSQANPVTLAMMTVDDNPLMPEPIKNIMRYSTHEWLKTGERFSRRYLRAVPDIGRAMSMFYSVAAQDYKGDVNIVPSFRAVDPRKLLAQLTEEEIAELMLEGERATWSRLEQIRICSRISQRLDKILADNTPHSYRISYMHR